MDELLEWRYVAKSRYYDNMSLWILDDGDGRVCTLGREEGETEWKLMADIDRDAASPKALRMVADKWEELNSDR